MREPTHTRRFHAIRRAWLRQLLALSTVLVLLVGLAPPAAAARPDVGAEADKLEPALQRAVQANPTARFNVIVTRVPAADPGKRRAHQAEVEDAGRAQGGQVHARLGLINGHLMTLPGKGVLALARNPRVKSISLNHKVKLQQAVSTTASAIQSLETVTANAPQVWSTYGNQGAGITVAVLDSGVNPSPDITGEVFGVDITTGGTVLADRGGHGTHVAGIIAGNGMLSAGGYEGVAPLARILMVKVTNDTGGASYASIIKGLTWVLANAKTYNIKVINLSLGAPVSSGYLDDPLDAAVELVWFRGITVVASAGNSGSAPGTIAVPGNDPYIVTVGAYDDNQTAPTTDDVIPDWSSRGPTPYDGFNKPDIAASGRRVVSLRVIGSYLDTLLPDRVTQTNYFRLSGTSMAAPVVSGVAALVLGANSRLSPNQVKYVLKQTARPLPYDVNTVGAGAVDALAAVQLAIQGVSTSKANVGQTPNRKMGAAIWPVVRNHPPVWRNKGLWKGRMWVDGSWDASGFKLADGSWDDGSWDYTAVQNYSWDDGSWDDGSWDDGSWDSLSTDSITWDSGTWDSSEWDTVDTSPSVLP